MIPTATRQAVLLRCGGKCECCHESKPLELHHLTYEVVVSGDILTIDGREEPEDLLALCHGCHRAKHRDANGDYWREEDEKFWYWFGFYEED